MRRRVWAGETAVGGAEEGVGRRDRGRGCGGGCGQERQG